MLDTATLPPKDPTAPKPWWQSKSVILGAVLTLVGLSTYFTDPTHTPTLTVASASEAVGGVLAIVLRVWFTAAPIAGTGLAEKAEVAKQDIALHAALNAAPVPTSTIGDARRLVTELVAQRDEANAVLAQIAAATQPPPAVLSTPPAGAAGV
jgi:hypothetical protein